MAQNHSLKSSHACILFHKAYTQTQLSFTDYFTLTLPVTVKHRRTPKMVPIIISVDEDLHVLMEDLKMLLEDRDLSTLELRWVGRYEWNMKIEGHSSGALVRVAKQEGGCYLFCE